jgi:ribose/xylose/arabinose/galactoside ABC-type transport system permease subunit
MAVTEPFGRASASVGRRIEPGRKWRKLAADNVLVVVLLAIICIGAVSSQYYFTAQNIENFLRSVAIFGILALGMTPVLLTGRIDLSVGAIMIFSVVIAVDLMIWIEALSGVKALVRGNTYKGGEFLLILIALATGGLVGLVNGVGVALLRIPAFIMTLATMTALRGLSFLLTNGHPYYLKTPFYSWLGSSVILGVPVSMWVCLSLFALLALVLGRTVAGRRIYAIGGHERTAEVSGINIPLWIILAFTASGLFAAIAGVLFTARLASVDAPLAAGYELSAIAVAAIGGTSLSGGRGSAYRTFLGALVLAAVMNLMNMLGIGTWYQNLVLGLVVILAVAAADFGRRRTART